MKGRLALVGLHDAMHCFFIISFLHAPDIYIIISLLVWFMILLLLVELHMSIHDKKGEKVVFHVS